MSSDSKKPANNSAPNEAPPPSMSHLSACTLPPAVTSARVPGLSYHDAFLTAAEQADLLTGIRAHPSAWKTLRNRTLQNWGGLPHAKGMLPTTLPSFLHPLITRLSATNLFPSDAPPNHVLVNRYYPGQGIDPHTDGPAYKPVATIVSLCSTLVMHFTHVDNRQHVVARVLLRPGSLLVLEEKAYTDFLHAIDEVLVDHIDDSVFNAAPHEVGTALQRQERLSLTVRASARTLRHSLLGRTRR